MSQQKMSRQKMSRQKISPLSRFHCRKSSKTVRRCFSMSVFLKILQYSQEYSCAGVSFCFKVGVYENFAIFTRRHLSWSLFLIKLQACNLCFPVHTAKFSRPAFFYKTPPVAASGIGFSRYETSIV